MCVTEYRHCFARPPPSPRSALPVRAPPPQGLLHRALDEPQRPLGAHLRLDPRAEPLLGVGAARVGVGVGGGLAGVGRQLREDRVGREEVRREGRRVGEGGGTEEEL